MFLCLRFSELRCLHSVHVEIQGFLAQRRCKSLEKAGLCNAGCALDSTCTCSTQIPKSHGITCASLWDVTGTPHQTTFQRWDCWLLCEVDWKAVRETCGRFRCGATLGAGSGYWVTCVHIIGFPLRDPHVGSRKGTTAVEVTICLSTTSDSVRGLKWNSAGKLFWNILRNWLDP